MGAEPPEGQRRYWRLALRRRLRSSGSGRRWSVPACTRRAGDGCRAAQRSMRMFGGTGPTARPARPALRRLAALGAPGPSRVKPGRAGSSRAGRCRSARCPKRPVASSFCRMPSAGAHLAGRLLWRLGACRLHAHAAAFHVVLDANPHRTAPHLAADNNTPCVVQQTTDPKRCAADDAQRAACGRHRPAHQAPREGARVHLPLRRRVLLRRRPVLFGVLRARALRQVP